MNFIFIINPASGNNKGYYISQIIESYCNNHNLNYRIIFTTRPNEAKEIVNIYKNYENTTIFSVGGDGTLNEVVNGIVNSTAKLGIIPAGTGNDFYRTFETLDANKIDVGRVNDRYFINVASIGLDAEIANYANKLKNGRLSNKSVYILGILHEYFLYKPIDIKVDDITKTSTILTVCNAKYYGNGFKIAPEAKLNDGLFDVVDVESLNKLQIINLIIKLAKAKHLESERVNFYRTDSLRISSSVPLNCNIDGEIIKNTSFDFSLEKDAINIDVNNSRILTKLLRSKRIIK